MGLLAGLGRRLERARAERAARANGRSLKELLRASAEERDRTERRTGVRPPIDDSTRLYMQKVLGAWAAEGRRIDEDLFWREVDYNRQFTHPVGFYELRRG